MSLCYTRDTLRRRQNEEIICSDHRGKLRNRYGVCTAACSRGVSSGTGCTQRGPVTGTGAGITKEEIENKIATFTVGLAADEVVFSYDSDAAGQRATVRAVSIAKEAGLKVRVLIVPDGKDPDEFVRKHGKDAYLRLIETAVSGIEFQMQYVISQNNVSNLAGKVEAVSNILPFLLECKNEIEVAQHIKTLAQRLTIDEGLIMSEYRKLSRKNDRGEAVSKWQVQPNVLSAEDLAEQLLLYVILKNTDLALVYRDKIDSVGFMSKFRGEIYEGLLKQLDAGSKSAADKLFTELSNEAATELAQIMTKDLAEENGEKLVDDCLRQMRRGALERSYEEHRLRADEYERLGDDRFLQELAESQKIKDEIKKLY